MLWRYFHLRSTRKLYVNIHSHEGATPYADSDIVKIGQRRGRNGAKYREAKLSVETKINTAAYAPTTRSKKILSPRYSTHVSVYRRFSRDSSSPILVIAIDVNTGKKKKPLCNIRFSQKNLHTLSRNQ